MPRFKPRDAPKSSALIMRYLVTSPSPFLAATYLILGQTNVCEQTGRHRLRREVLFRQRPGRLTVPLIVRVDGLNGLQRLRHRRKSEEALTRREDVAKPRILRHDRLPRGQITGIPFAKPAAAQADVLVLGHGKFG